MGILINTAMNRGAGRARDHRNRFNGFFAARRETVKTVEGFRPD
jgi:hypothetical protein